MEFVEKVQNVTSIDETIHWFCPRNETEDFDYFFDEDLATYSPERPGLESEEQRSQRHKQIEESVQRADQVLDAFAIFAFDGDDARPVQRSLSDALSKQLRRCDTCIREYHRARARLRTGLEGEYDTDAVQKFMENFDAMNKDRISRGLDSGRETLLALPENKRNISNAGEVGMYAMFETLNCIPYLEDEELLGSYFDRPFQLVQTNKKVKLSSYSPGMISFLYSEQEVRLSWAKRNYSLIKRSMLAPEFDSIRPFFEAALNRVHISCLDDIFLPTFWRGTHLLLTKFDHNLITTRLRALDANVWTMSLEHFQLDLPHFNDLIACYALLLERGPREFWDAMGSINPQAVLDTIFKAPRLEKAMIGDANVDFSWIEPFLGSIQPNNLVPPLRAMIDQFLKRYQQSQYSRAGQQLAHEMGFRAILQALRTIKERNVRGPVLVQLLELVEKDHLKTIMSKLEGVEQKDEMRLDKMQDICLQIVELSLALDCRNLAADRFTIMQTSGLPHQAFSAHNTWRMSLRGIKPGHPTLAAAVIAGTQELLGLERLSPRQIEKAPKPAEQWNSTLARIQGFVVDDLLDRLQTFAPEQLLALFEDQRATPGLFALLFSGEQSIHQAALDVFKSISGEDNRRESLMRVTSEHFDTTVKGVVGALKVIARSKCFSPCPNMLRLATDLYSCLCDDADGILRSGREYKGIVVLESLWQASWTNLSAIFEQTEAWSNLGYEKAMLQTFCRATMDFAENIFDQYSLIANAIGDDTKSIGKRLLESPRAVFTNISRWLRLRDDYLISKAVGLTCKMLGRFQEAGIMLTREAVVIAEGVLSNKVKTKLSVNQKAEIQRALEDHFGELFSDAAEPALAEKKQSFLQDWTSGASSGRSTPVDNRRKGTIDVDVWSAAAKKQDSGRQAPEKVAPGMATFKQQEAFRKQASKPLISARQLDEEKRRLEFQQKRKADKEEAERKRAAAIAKANGVGAGSGVIGLGDIGKDHSLKGQNVMVSSDEDDDSDGDDFDEDLFGPTIKKEKSVRQSNGDFIGMNQKAGPTKIKRTQRSFKDMRARLAPNLQPLHRTILKWDFFHQGDYPPGFHEHQFQRVQNVFTDPVSYQQTFEPLLTLEAWQGMVKSREENVFKPYDIRIQGRSNVDSFIEISSTIEHAENRELQLSEGDIILLSQAKKPSEREDAPHCLARIYRVKRQKGHLEIVYQLMPGSGLDKYLTTQSTIHALKIQSIIPLEREYGALLGLQYYDLCTQIIRARPSDRMTHSEKKVAAYQDNWNVNKAQAEAIGAALRNEGFSLIQGPPGSGKTKTIVAIVGGLLTTQLAHTAHGTKINVPGKTGSDAAPRKLLVCAPSNAAVDELVMRLKDGVKTESGKQHMINVVRLGRSDAINSQVLDVTMDELVSKRLGTSDQSDARAKAHEIFKEHERVSAELKSLMAARDDGQVKGQDAVDLQDKITAVRRRKNELGTKIDGIKDQERNAGREAELNRKRAQQAVLDEAHVICATLSGSGHDMFQSLNIEFETVIIDEAAQCVEMSSLIPLKYGCVKCIMVGDPKQLPPTVFSKEAAKFQYEQSLFVRMQNNAAKEVHLLDTQYRMHPEISVFPSRTFYDGLLKDGQGMAGLRERPWHASALLAPYRFFDVQGAHTAKGHSLVNTAEIDVALALYHRVRSDFGSKYDLKSKIGIITPYKSQLRALKERFSSKYGRDILDLIEFNTTDAFQGRESEIIIFSCVRASPAGGIGFLQDIRRMNVGLTRAKSSLWVLGNSESLVRGRYWKLLVEDARARDAYSTGDVVKMLAAPSSGYVARKDRDSSMHDVSSHQRQMINQPSDHRKPIKQEEAQAAAAVPDSAAVAHFKKEPLSGDRSDKMEGVTYRYEDIKKKTKRPATGMDDRPARPRLDVSDVDVDMADAPDSVRSDTSRPATPPAITKKPAARPNGVAGAHKVIRRPDADPFIRPKRR